MEKAGFFNNPDRFSFKDILAIAIVIPFITMSMSFLVFLLIDGRENLEYIIEFIKVYTPIMVVVLGGYFGQEMASNYLSNKNTCTTPVVTPVVETPKLPV